MGKANGVSRGDRNRNARLARLREHVPLGNAMPTPQELGNVTEVLRHQLSPMS